MRNPKATRSRSPLVRRELLKIEGMEDLMRAVLEVRDDEGEIVLEFPFVEAILDGAESDADDTDISVTKH